MKDELKIVIPIAPRTKKNSQRIVIAHNRPIIMPSALYKQYEKSKSIIKILYWLKKIVDVTIIF